METEQHKFPRVITQFRKNCTSGNNPVIRYTCTHACVLLCVQVHNTYCIRMYLKQKQY